MLFHRTSRNVTRKLRHYSTKYFWFELIHKSKKSDARVGRIHTPHGIIDTPSFVAVGTNGTVKCLDNSTVEELGIQLMFCNTFHLLVHPGTEVIEKAGGLHKFINRKSPIITDSGGFQVFSLAYSQQEQADENAREAARELKGMSRRKDMLNNLVSKITEDGVVFRSYRDGREITLTPESSVDAQKSFGADIIIPFDELPPYNIDPEKLKESLDRTHRWEERSLMRHLENPKNQAMYSVIHGGVDHSLRQKSIDFLTKLPFDGIAIGGSLGKDRDELIDLLSFVMPRIPKELPNHVLGIGDLESITRFIHLGVDTFDSAYPTRAGRHGNFFTKNGVINIANGRYRNDFSKIEEDCECAACKNYTRAYLHHLFKTFEPTLGNLGTIHNLHFLVKLMKNYREKILNDEI